MRVHHLCIKNSLLHFISLSFTIKKLQNGEAMMFRIEDKTHIYGLIMNCSWCERNQGIHSFPAINNAKYHICLIYSIVKF